MLIRRLFSRVVLFSIALALPMALGTLTTQWALGARPYQVALAASFTVDSTADAVDANPGDGVCDDGTGNCTLRAAIMEANALAGPDTIDVPSGTYLLTIPETGPPSGTGENASATGDLDITDDLTITGDAAASTIIDGGGVSRMRGFHVLEGSQLMVTGVTIQGGRRVAGGGNVGGGILIDGSGSVLILTNSTVRNNTAAGGGGIWVQGFASLTLTNSIVNGNTAEDKGGGIYNNSGTLTISNSTISSNISGGIGTSGGTTKLTHSTVTGNTGGGISGIIEIKSTIIANQPSGGDCSESGITSLGHNLDSDNTCGLTEPTDLPNTDPLLGPLQDNGGPTETHALLLSSPAIDHIPVADCTDTGGNPITTDQRGVARPQGSGCDIGAYEFEPPPPPAAPDLTIDKDDGGVTAMPGDNITYTLTYDNVGNQDATGVVITDTVPASTTFNPGSSTAGWVCAPDTNAGSTCTFTIGGLPVGGGAMVDFAVDVDDPLAAGVTRIVNRARISDDGTHGVDQNPGDNSDGEFTRIAGARPVGGTSIFLGDDSDSKGVGLAVLAGSVAGALALLAAGGWYARRQWLRRG